MTERFALFSSVLEPFNFLYNITTCSEIEDTELEEKCISLEKALSERENKDIDAEELQIEIKLLSRKIEVARTPEKILKWIFDHDLEELFPNVIIALRILLTLPISVAKGERTFSKLKLIKNYLRSSLGQEKLNGLAIISIENNIAQTIKIDEMVEEFAKAKARRIPFIVR